jgi:hypothetical protein
MQAASSLRHAYGMHAWRRQQQACVWEAAADGTCTRVTTVCVRSDRGHSPEWLSLASHLRSRSFIGPPSAYDSVRCWWHRRRVRDALHLFACPCWPTLIRRPEVPCASEKAVKSTKSFTSKNRPNEIIGGTAQSVRASDTSDCRCQHPPAPWQISNRTPPGTLVGTPRPPVVCVCVCVCVCARV